MGNDNLGPAYKQGDVLYRVTFAPIYDDVQVTAENLWVLHKKVHPSAKYVHKILPTPVDPLPKLGAVDFDRIVPLLGMKPVVEEFVVWAVRQCEHTGEWLYVKHNREEIPESCLFADKESAEAEIYSIGQSVITWADRMIL